MDIPTITTERLLLRPFRESDAEPLHRILAGEDILRYFPSPRSPSLEQVQRFIAGQLKHWEDRGYGWWAVVPQGQDRLIGWCGLQYLPDTDETEVAFLLDKPYWGQGLATEAGLTSLHFGFEQLGMQNPIVAIVHLENKASQRVIEKLGMARTRQAEYFGIDCYRYEIQPEAFGQKTAPSAYRVIQPHQGSIGGSLSARRGQRLAFEQRESEFAGWLWCTDDAGTGAWVPESWVRIEGPACVLLRDYDAVELSIQVGEILESTLEESGWAWVSKENGQRGWVPLACLEKA